MHRSNESVETQSLKGKKSCAMRESSDKKKKSCAMRESSENAVKSIQFDVLRQGDAWDADVRQGDARDDNVSSDPVSLEHDIKKISINHKHESWRSIAREINLKANSQIKEVDKHILLINKTNSRVIFDKYIPVMNFGKYSNTFKCELINWYDGSRVPVNVLLDTGAMCDSIIGLNAVQKANIRRYGEFKKNNFVSHKNVKM